MTDDIRKRELDASEVRVQQLAPGKELSEEFCWQIMLECLAFLGRPSPECVAFMAETDEMRASRQECDKLAKAA